MSLFFLFFVGLFTSCNPGLESKKFAEIVSPLFDSSLKPFYHGVASGDPLSDRVILWTRVTPDDSTDQVDVIWEIAESADFTSIYKSDTARALAAHDYTVKVDVDGLFPNRVYYYRFSGLGKYSIIGRTKTAPVGNIDSVKFAVATCANWEWGYFNSYARIGDRDILDGVIHLGDYIYEHAPGVYGDTTIGRKHLPPHELLSLADYRTRYSQYRLDPGLRHAHQQQPFIPIWDDHEIANNSNSVGAQNHQPNEGDYQLRKAAARQAYYEWMPIREGNQLYRSFAFGNLVDLIMLDERLAGKTRPVDSIQDPTYFNEDRSVLGAAQLGWFENQLAKSKASWKVVGNQVLFSDMDLTAIRPNAPHDLDSWSGYPTEKKKIRNFIVDNHIHDLILVTGDTHASWAIEAATEVSKTYAPFAIELCTTSISSANGDESASSESVRFAEQELLRMNPHVKFFNDRDHGYLLVSLYSKKAKAEWYFVETVRKPDDHEHLGRVFALERGSLKLK